MENFHDVASLAYSSGRMSAPVHGHTASDDLMASVHVLTHLFCTGFRSKQNWISGYHIFVPISLSLIVLVPYKGDSVFLSTSHDR